MNTQALQRITNPSPPSPGSTGERILAMHRKAKTTAKLKAEIEARKAHAEPDANVRGWLDMISGRDHG